MVILFILKNMIYYFLKGSDLMEVTTMKLTGELKEQVEKAENKEEAKEMIREAGVKAGM